VSSGKRWGLHFSKKSLDLSTHAVACHEETDQQEVREDRTLSEIVEQVLRQYLDKQQKKAK
jgi:hypothetical protein